MSNEQIVALWILFCTGVFLIFVAASLDTGRTRTALFAVAAVFLAPPVLMIYLKAILG